MTLPATVLVFMRPHLVRLRKEEFIDRQQGSQGKKGKVSAGRTGSRGQRPVLAVGFGNGYARSIRSWNWPWAFGREKPTTTAHCAVIVSTRDRNPANGPCQSGSGS